MIKFLNKEANKSLDRFYKHLITHNRGYRLFTFLIIVTQWLNFSYSSLFSFDFIIELFFGIFPIYFIVLLLIDKKFNRFITAINVKASRVEAIKKQKEKEELAENIKLVLTIPLFLGTKIIKFLTKLPMMNNFFGDRLFHYKNRHLLKFMRVLQGPLSKEKFKVTNIDLDHYHATFDIKFIKSQPKCSIKKSIENSIRKYFDQTPPGVVIKLKSTTAQVLIPKELLTDSQEDSTS